MVVRHDERELDQLFKALANSTRRDIVRRTLAGEVTVSGLADAYAMSFAAVQKHVAVLESAGLVQKLAAGRERRVRADPEQLRRARAALEQLEHLWRERVGRLDDLLAEPECPQE